MAVTQAQPPRCTNLVLDAGPLLSLSPLRGLAKTYLTVPQVLAELKDNRAREHFERLGLISGVNIEIKSPDAASLAYGVFDPQPVCYLLNSGFSHPMGQENWRLRRFIACRSLCTGFNLYAAQPGQKSEEYDS
jgi:PIN domain of ribonuclease